DRGGERQRQHRIMKRDVERRGKAAVGRVGIFRGVVDLQNQMLADPGGFEAALLGRANIRRDPFGTLTRDEGSELHVFHWSTSAVNARCALYLSAVSAVTVLIIVAWHAIEAKQPAISSTGPGSHETSVRPLAPEA